MMCSQQEIYSPVSRMQTIRVLLSLNVEHDMFIHQLDVKCLFFNGDLPQPVYMEIPKGVELIMDIKKS